MKLLGDYIKSRRGVLLFFALAAVLLGVSFALFHLPLRAVAYPCALTLLLGLAALALDFVLCIVPAAQARAEGGALTGRVSPNASVLLFAPCGGTELFAYTDGGTTRLSAADGSRSAATEYPGQYAFLRGGAVTVASSLDDFFAIQRFDADTLDETDFFPLEIRADDLYALETDGFGRLYACLLYTSDAADE